MSHPLPLADEALYYNAVNHSLAGDRAKIGKLYTRAGSWIRSFQMLGRLNPWTPDPIKEWDKLTRAAVELFLPEDPKFPPLLKETPACPFGLYVKGTLLPPTAFPIALVGTRRASPEGKDIARRFARELTRAGMSIVSGLAFGIDAAAHEGCLDARGLTLAVLAGGLDAVYPKENHRLAQKILNAGGALISEYPLDSPAYKTRFLERNRLIAGLARGVLIVEAPLGSGALATARHALEANRDVFAIPGAITNPRFAGANALIRQGASLVSAPGEILDSYGLAAPARASLAAQASTSYEKLILQVLSAHSAPFDIDKLIEATRLEPQIVSRTLSFLLFRELIRETAGGFTI